jgi:four helix bundle protein
MYKTFQDMPVWQSAMSLAEMIFNLSDRLPKKEDYSLTSQVRRSALSISGNIAEAYGRKHTLDKLKFYYVARGSLTETQSHLVYGYRVGYFKKEHVQEMEKMLNTLHNDINKIIKSLANSGTRGNLPQNRETST